MKFVALIFKAYCNSMRYETQIRDDEYAATFVHHLRQFRDRQVMTDVTFKLHGKAIVCHKVVLGALSPILLDIFSKKKHSMSGIVVGTSSIVNTFILKKLRCKM